VGPRASLDAEAKGKKARHYTCRESNRGRPDHSVVIVMTELPRVRTKLKLNLFSRKLSVKYPVFHIEFCLLFCR
jgi:hypothetical protein